jgi:dipeptidyl aminopeptidase/acylaminoacyl peptidase
MQTSNFVNGNEPPMLLLHGEEDTTVGVFNQEVLISALNKMGNPSVGTLYPKLTHISILMSLTPLLRKGSTTIEDMDKFFKSLIRTTT